MRTSTAGSQAGSPPRERRLSRRGGPPPLAARHVLPAAALLALALAATSPSGAQGRSGDFVPDDAVTVIVVERQILGIVTGRGQVAAELEGDEELLWSGSRGLVGIAVTNRRALGISPASNDWQELRHRLGENDVGTPLLGHEVGLVLTRWRMLAFDALRGRWTRHDFSPGEQVLGQAVDTSMAVVVTNRQALGLRAGSGRIESQRLSVHERFQHVQAEGNVGIVTTSQRLLIHDGVWRERRLPIH